ncbi:glutamate receptor NMDA 2B isoform X5, partial [Brachionus plicatilis]
MDDLVWPGKQHKPPLGKPIKFHLKVVTLEEPPFVIFKDPFALNRSDPSQFRCASGFYVDLMIELSDKLQFTFDIYEVEDKTWGGKSKSGEWNGLIKDLITNKADLAMTSLKITTERSEIIDFSVPFMETGIAIVVSLRPGTISTTAFLKPYDYLIWIMLLLVTLHSVAIAVFLFEWIVNKFRYKNKKVKRVFEFINDPKLKKPDPKTKAFTLVKVDDKSRFTFGKSLWLVWVLLFRVATKTQQPSGFASKFMVNIWATLCLAFTASYTANLAAFMIIREEYPDLKGVEDPRLTNPYGYKPAYKFGTVSSGSTEEIIKKNHPIMYDYMKKYMANNASHGIDLVKRRKLDAFLYDAVILDYRAGQDDGCKLRVVGSWYSMTGYGIALPKGSKYKEMIDRKIVEYSHSGELERTQRFWFSGTCKNVEENSRNSDQFGLLQSSSVFILLLAGIVIAAIILFADISFSSYISKKFQKVWFYENSSDKYAELNARIIENLLVNRLKKELVYLRSLLNGKVYAEKNDQIHSQSIPNLISAQDTDDDDYFSEKDNCLLNHVPNAQIQRKIFKLKSENMSEFSEF